MISTHRTGDEYHSGLFSGYLAPLTQAMIIYQATRVGHGVNHWTFNLQPDVRIYFNRAVKRGKIAVSRNGEYKWNL